MLVLKLGLSVSGLRRCKGDAVGAVRENVHFKGDVMAGKGRCHEEAVFHRHRAVVCRMPEKGRRRAFIDVLFDRIKIVLLLCRIGFPEDRPEAAPVAVDAAGDDGIG